MSEIRSRSMFFMALISVIVMAADQYTKWIALRILPQGEELRVTSFFNLVIAFNPGAAFGMLAGLGEGTRQAVLGVTTLAALLVVVFLATRSAYQSPAARTALALILGGAAGNIIDRFRIGYVVDFLDFHWNELHWPAFNVADSAICIGVAILLFVKPPKGAERKDEG